MDLSGIFAPLTTPFDDEGNFLADRLASDLEKYNATGLAGYLVLGSSGEAIYLSQTEKVEVLRVAFEAGGRGQSKTLLAGTGEESLRATLEVTEAAAKIGYPAAVVRTPHYYKGAMNSAALVRFYREVADRASIPILIYNMPPLTGLDMALDAILELAWHPRILGIKESLPNLDKVTRLVAGTATSGFAVLVGAASTLYPSLCAGAPGAILALASAAPEACVAIAEMLKHGDHEGALSAQRATLPACRVLGQYGVAGLKTAAQAAGYFGGAPRLPQLPLTADQRSEVEAAFRPIHTPLHAHAN